MAKKIILFFTFFFSFVVLAGDKSIVYTMKKSDGEYSVKIKEDEVYLQLGREVRKMDYSPCVLDRFRKELHYIFEQSQHLCFAYEEKGKIEVFSNIKKQFVMCENKYEPIEFVKEVYRCRKKQ